MIPYSYHSGRMLGAERLRDLHRANFWTQEGVKHLHRIRLWSLAIMVFTAKEQFCNRKHASTTPLNRCTCLAMQNSAVSLLWAQMLCWTRNLQALLAW